MSTAAPAAELAAGQTTMTVHGPSGLTLSDVRPAMERLWKSDGWSGLASTLDLKRPKSEIKSGMKPNPRC
jgi:hypothetical protein